MQQKPRVTEIQVRVDCNGCAQKIKKALIGIPGIHDLRVDFDRQRITIIGWADPELVVNAIKKKTKKNATICSNVEVTSSSSKQTEPKPEPKASVATTEPAQASEPTVTNTQHSSSQQWQNNLETTKEEGQFHHHHQQQQRPNYVNRFSSGLGYGDRSAAYHDSPVFLQESMYVTHCNSNRYIPSSYVTEYECVRSSPAWQTHYNGMEHHIEDYQHGNVNNIAALVSDDNPNSCSIV